MNPLGCFARKYNMVIFFSLVYIYNLHITGEMTTCHILWNTLAWSLQLSSGVHCRFKFSYVHYAVRFSHSLYNWANRLWKHCREEFSSVCWVVLQKLLKQNICSEDWINETKQISFEFCSMKVGKLLYCTQTIFYIKKPRQ